MSAGKRNICAISAAFKKRVGTSTRVGSLKSRSAPANTYPHSPQLGTYT